MTNAGTIRDTKSLQYLTWSYWLGEPEYISDVVKHLDRHTLSRNNQNKHFKKRYKIPAEGQSISTENTFIFKNEICCLSPYTRKPLK